MKTKLAIGPDAGDFSKYLAKYLEGDAVPSSWRTTLTKRRSADSPSVLYRLCVVPQSTLRIGKDVVVNLKKLVISASDERANAKYAGCSYHFDNETNLDNKALVLIQIQNPEVLMSFSDLLNWARSPACADSLKFRGYAEVIVRRLEHEREFLILGPISGKIIEVVSKRIVDDRSYKSLLS